MRYGPPDLNFDGVVSDTEVVREIGKNRDFMMEPGRWTFEVLSFEGGDAFRLLTDVFQGSKELGPTEIEAVLRHLEIDGKPMLPFDPGKCIFESKGFFIRANTEGKTEHLQGPVRCDLEDPNALDSGSPGSVNIVFSRSCMKGWVRLSISDAKKFGTNQGFTLDFRAKKDDSCDRDPFFGQAYPAMSGAASATEQATMSPEEEAYAIADDAAAAAAAASDAAAAATSAAADAAGVVNFYIVADANRRSRATATSSNLGKISRGTMLQGATLIGEDGVSSWLQLADGTGFVSSVNISNTAPPQLATIFGERRFHPSYDLQPHSSPSEQSPVVDTVPAGTLLILSGITQDGFAEAKGRRGGVGYFRASGHDLSR
jgi:hypothetical protein